MKKPAYYFFLLLFLFGTAQVRAQDSPLAPKLSTIKVNGTALIRVAPDQALMTMTVKAIDMDLNQSVRTLEEKSGKLVEKLRQAGFRREEIKTSHLNVQDNGRWRNGEYIDSGYVAQQHIELRFKRDQQRIARLLEAFSQEDGAEALFQLAYELSDEGRDKAYETLLRKAVGDARSKAETLAGASGVKLGEIRHIVYGQPNYGPMPMQHEMMEMDMRAGMKQGMAEMEVREIELQDRVTIYWEIR